MFDYKTKTLEFIRKMGEGDVDYIVNAYCDDGRVRTMGNTLISGVRSKPEIAEFASGVLTAFPKGLTFKVTGITTEGSRVAVEATSQGIHASGVEYCNSYHFLFQWQDGKLLELVEYMDTELVSKVLCGQ